MHYAIRSFIEFVEEYNNGRRDFSNLRLYLGTHAFYSAGKTISNVNFTNSTISNPPAWLNCVNCNFTNATIGRNDSISGCSFTDCNFTNACMLDGYVYKSIFTNCNFDKTDISRTKYIETDCSGMLVSKETNMEYTDFRRAKNISTSIAKITNDDLPPLGVGFSAWKKALIKHHTYNNDFYHTSNQAIIQLFIPPDALRSRATTRKCRANKARIISIKSLEDDITLDIAYSLHDQDFIYDIRTPDLVIPDFNRNRWHECTSGIHFFTRRHEAEDYRY